MSYIIALVVIVLIGAGIWWWLRKKQRESEVHALVWLLSKPRITDAKELAAIVGKALGRNVSGSGLDGSSNDEKNDTDGTQFLVGQAPLFVLTLDEGMFLINCFDRPYINDREAAAENTEERLAEAIRSHWAWVSVDVLGGGTQSKTELQASYRILGKIAAALYQPDCLALYTPASGRMHLPGKDLIDHLQDNNVLEHVNSNTIVPVAQIAQNDPRMLAAQQEARDQWPKFVQMYETKDGEMFAVKAPFGGEDEREFMWILVTAIEGDIILGTLGNDPLHKSNGRSGDTKRVSVGSINDWMVIKDKQQIGGFTVKIAVDAMKK